MWCLGKLWYIVISLLYFDVLWCLCSALISLLHWYLWHIVISLIYCDIFYALWYLCYTMMSLKHCNVMSLVHWGNSDTLWYLLLHYANSTKLRYIGHTLIPLVYCNISLIHFDIFSTLWLCCDICAIPWYVSYTVISLVHWYPCRLWYL